MLKLPQVRSRTPLWMGLGLGAAAFGLMAFTSGCGKPVDRAQDQKQVESAIEHLGSGQVVGQISRDAQAPLVAGHGALADQPSTGGVAPGAMGDPCPNVPVVAAGAGEPTLQNAMKLFGACLRAQLEKASPARGAFDYFKSFTLNQGERPLSTMTDEELKTFLAAHPHTTAELVGVDSPEQARVRDRFTDAELDELQALATRKRDALARAEARIFAAVDAHASLVDDFASSNVRYAALLALRQTAGDATGASTGQALATLLQAAHIGVPQNLAGFPSLLLHPYAIQAIVPDRNQELSPLNPQSENPFRAVLDALGDFGGPAGYNQRLRNAYAGARDHDNPAIADHAPAAAAAARVAVVDTGIDFVKYPDLALFLGPSHDYADDDSNPWIPAEGELAHGSGTSATVLTLLAHHAPEVLRDRRVETRMWKVSSVRSVLAGDSGTFGAWDSRFGIQSALIDQMRSTAADRPDVVSISAVFPLQIFLANLHQQGLVKRAPWLWVMAAGNEGVEVSSDPMPACLSDVPAAERDDSRILCVGALIQGVVNDRVAGYSNFGPRVDVYAYQSYIDLCPNGTSCATPAITAAATLLKARFPSLTAAQLKQAIVSSAEERTLAVDGEGASSGAPATRTVKVFDPPTMMDRAIENARHLVGGA